MKSEFIPYEQAVEIKELGFDKSCFAYYAGAFFGDLMIKEIPHCVISAPSFSQAFRWFREKYKGVHEIVRRKDYDYLEFIGWVYIDNKRIDVNSYWIPLSYEEAELACLKKLIEIVKSK
jgi:hypothetical protein